MALAEAYARAFEVSAARMKAERKENIADIKRAYRKLALLYHPDRSGDPSTAEKLCRFRKPTNVG
jgi:curved DNA-binding protein CbpA